MRPTRLLTAAVAVALAAGSAPAAELVFPSLSYRTGAYAPNGIPFADGYADYFTLVNERDGGIGGIKIRVAGMRDRLQHRKGRRMLRSDQG